MTHDDIDHLLADMHAEGARLTAAGDARRFFHATYTRTTRAVADEIERGGFADNDWVRRWDLAFADYYLAALAADRAGEPVAGPWRVAFDTARDHPEMPPVRQVLFGMNAHINYDLPQALLRVIDEAGFDDEGLLATRLADHHHLDTVLLSRIGAEDEELAAVSQLTLLDRLIRPLNRTATGRFLTESGTRSGATPASWIAPAAPAGTTTGSPTSSGCAPPGCVTWPRPGRSCCASRAADSGCCCQAPDAPAG